MDITICIGNKERWYTTLLCRLWPNQSLTKKDTNPLLHILMTHWMPCQGQSGFQPLTLQVATVDDDIMANILDVYSKAALQILTPSNAEKY